MLFSVYDDLYLIANWGDGCKLISIRMTRPSRSLLRAI